MGVIPVFAPAHVCHLAMLRTLIREAAAEGSFDRALAADTPAAVEFFARLKRALVSGYFVEEDPKTGRVESIAVPGYVFWPDDRNSSIPPVEFGRRGGGYGRELLNALFATPPGKKTWVVRIPRGSRYGAMVQHLLKSYGFDHAGDTAHLRWFVRQSAPTSIAARVRSAVGLQAPLN